MLFGRDEIVCARAMRVKGKGKWGRKEDQKWNQLSVISQENALSYWITWDISGQASWNHSIWELSLRWAWGSGRRVTPLTVLLFLTGQIQSRGYEIPTLLGFVWPSSSTQPTEKPQTLQLWPGLWFGDSGLYQLGVSRSLLIMVVVGLYHPQNCVSQR